MGMIVNVECECTDRELWELKNRVLGLGECDGVSKVTFVKEND